MLNPVSQKWVEALRSGKYEQGTGRLRSADNTYCCLGVLCDLAVKAGVIPEPEKDDLYTYIDGSYGVLPTTVKKWAGLTSATGTYRPDRFESELTVKNDTGATFAQIADIIESEPKGLFTE